MSPGLLLAVTAAGSAGSVARWLVTGALPRPSAGLLAVNVLGSLLLGVATGLSLGGDARAVVGAGFCGGFTTFSTVSVAAAVDLRDGRLRHAAAQLLLTVVLTVSAAALGLVLALR